MNNHVKNTFLNSSIALMIVIVISKLLGMFRDIVLANFYGTSSISDAYLIAVSVPTLLFYFIGHALSTAYIPIYNQVKKEKGVLSAQKYTNSILCASALIASLLVVFLILWPEVVVKIFAAGFNDETVNIASGFIRICAVDLLLMVCIEIFSGYLQIKNNFIIPAIVSVPRNIIVIISIIVAYFYGTVFLGIGILGAYVGELLILLPFIRKENYRFHFSLDLHNGYLKDTLFVSIPIIIGVAVNQINTIVDKSLASLVVEGGISALSYASVINTAVQQILVTGVVTILFAKCSYWAANNMHNIIVEKLTHTLKILLFLLIPATAGVVICSNEIVSTILLHGNFDQTSLMLTRGCLIYYSIGLPFLAVRDTLVKVYYSYKKTKIVTCISVASILLNIILNLLLYKDFGLNGLALATSVSIAVNAIALCFGLKKLLLDFSFRSIGISIFKSTVSTVVMILILLVIKSIFKSHEIKEVLQLVLYVLAGISSYLLCSIALKNSLIIDLISMLKKKIKKQ